MTNKSNGHVVAAALDYAARGWSVFPARFRPDKNGKWEKLSWKSAAKSNGRAWGQTSDPDEIRRDFAKPGRNAIGLPTGAGNGIFVVEADTLTGHDVDGLASLATLEEEHDKLPDTLMGESPTGSPHYYFKHPGNGLKVNCSSSKLAPGVDVKGDGGMVIAPPSVRPGKGEYRWLNNLPIAEPPAWLLELVTADDEPANQSGEGTAPAWKVAAALAMIPNDAKVQRDHWIKIGMATHAATGGSDAGFAAFDAWSRKWPHYNEDDTRTAWSGFKPDRIGAGTLFHLASEADPNWLRRYHPGDDGPLALGYTRDGNYAFRERTRNLIRQLNANQLLSHQSLLGLMPSEFWIERFRQVTKDKVWFSQFGAGEALIAACKSAGPFNPAQVRGRGIWRESDDIIINFGDPVPATAKHRYVCFEPIRFELVTEFDVARLLRLLRLFPWKNEQDAMLVLGWTALAPICGVLSWRPHGFIWGPPKCGKTTLHLLLKYLLTPLVIATDGGSSEAGIRQMLGPDSQPVIIDEFENDQAGDNIRRVMKLMRSASSADNPLLRGTPEGRAMQFSLCTTFMVCAVNITGLSPADQSRILLLELINHTRDKVVAQQIAAELAYFTPLGPQWCGYMVSRARLIQPALNVFQQQMPVADRHHQQNFATILAAAFVALEGRAPTADEATQWIADYAPAMQRHAEDNERDNAIECLEQLKAHIVDGYPLGRWIATVLSDDEEHQLHDAQRIAQAYGIKTEDDEQGGQLVYIRHGAPNVNDLYRHTVWRDRAWQRALRTLDGAFSPKVPPRFSSSDKSRAVAIPTSYFSDEPVEFRYTKDAPTY